MKVFKKSPSWEQRQVQRDLTARDAVATMPRQEWRPLKISDDQRKLIEKARASAKGQPILVTEEN